MIDGARAPIGILIHHLLLALDHAAMMTCMKTNVKITVYVGYKDENLRMEFWKREDTGDIVYSSEFDVPIKLLLQAIDKAANLFYRLSDPA